ncbi:hypothetical protein [Amorphus sp. MBR-141]
MSGNPWGKFFWNDWETDPALRLCSLAAQGLWMRVLCVCAKANPKGYLVAAGRSLSPADMARLVGSSEQEIETLLSELASNGVFSRDAKGRIYSRRMVRDEKKSRIARKNGKEGGNPTLCKQKGNHPSDNPRLNLEDKPHKPKPEAEAERTTNYGSNEPSFVDARPKRASPAKRGSRLPADWTLPKPWGDWAMQEFGASADDIRREAAKFRDYWHAKTGQGATKADWQATWRNWIRTAIEHGSVKPSRTAATASPADQRSWTYDELLPALQGWHANGYWPWNAYGPAPDLRDTTVPWEFVERYRRENPQPHDQEAAE